MHAEHQCKHSRSSSLRKRIVASTMTDDDESTAATAPAEQRLQVQPKEEDGQTPKEDQSESARERFQIREPLLDQALSKSLSLRALAAGAAALFLLPLLSRAIKYAIMPYTWRMDVGFVGTCFGHTHILLLYELLSVATFVLVALPVSRSKSRVIRVPGIMLSSITTAVLAPLLRFYFNVHEVIALALVLEQARFAMKLVSFLVETSQRQADAEKRRQEETRASIGSTLYFLFAPTLIYQHSYPRSPTRNWRRLTACLLQLLAIMWMAVILLNSGFTRTFSVVGRHPLSAPDYADMVSAVTPLGPLMACAIGYAIMHC